MITGSLHPGIRAAIGVIVLVLGVVLHRVVLDVAGAVVLALSAGHWLYATRKNGTGTGTGAGTGTRAGTGTGPDGGFRR